MHEILFVTVSMHGTDAALHCNAKKNSAFIAQGFQIQTSSSRTFKVAFIHEDAP